MNKLNNDESVDKPLEQEKNPQEELAAHAPIDSKDNEPNSTVIIANTLFSEEESIPPPPIPVQQIMPPQVSESASELQAFNLFQQNLLDAQNLEKNNLDKNILQEEMNKENNERLQKMNQEANELLQNIQRAAAELQEKILYQQNFLAAQNLHKNNTENNLRQMNLNIQTIRRKEIARLEALMEESKENENHFIQDTIAIEAREHKKTELLEELDEAPEEEIALENELLKN